VRNELYVRSIWHLYELSVLNTVLSNVFLLDPELCIQVDWLVVALASVDPLVLT